MAENRYIVIMAGGRGERFWPESRQNKPKHLLPIVGDTTMLEQTLERLLPLVPLSNILILTSYEHTDLVRELCPQLPPENIIGEPIGRDTAPAVGLAMLLIQERNPHATFALLPADHVIHDHSAFQSTLLKAFEIAENNDLLVTIGIQPTQPATGYGYIKKGQNLLNNNPTQGTYLVDQFVEKPDLAHAQQYLASEQYLWNAGMFVWKLATIEKAFEKLQIDLYEEMLAIRSGLKGGDPLDHLLRTIYPSLKKISIDYAIMEHAKNVAVVEATFDWDDVGSWPSITNHQPTDPQHNTLKGLVQVIDSKNCIIHSTSDHVVGVIGLEDLIVVHTPDATLVCHKNRAQDIKKLVQQLTEEQATKNFT